MPPAPATREARRQCCTREPAAVAQRETARSPNPRTTVVTSLPRRRWRPRRPDRTPPRPSLHRQPPAMLAERRRAPVAQAVDLLHPGDGPRTEESEQRRPVQWRAVGHVAQQRALRDPLRLGLA